MIGFQWLAETLSKEGALRHRDMDLPAIDRFYVFSPHPDDMSISLGAFVIMAVRAGVSPYSVLMTDGSEAAIPKTFLKRHGWKSIMSALEAKKLRGAIRVKEAREEAQRLGISEEALILLQKQSWFEEHRTPSEAMNIDGSIREANSFRPGPLKSEAIEEIRILVKSRASEKVLCAVPSPHDRLSMHRMTTLAVIKALAPLAFRYPNRYSVLIYRCFSTKTWAGDAGHRVLGFGEEVMNRKCLAILACKSMKARREAFGGYTNQGSEFYDILVRSENTATARRSGLSSPYAECFQWCDTPGSSLWKSLVRDAKKNFKLDLT